MFKGNSKFSRKKNLWGDMDRHKMNNKNRQRNETPINQLFMMSLRDTFMVYKIK